MDSRTSLLITFALHNAEEVWLIPSDVRALREVTGLQLSWLNRRTFGTATALLTGVVAGVLLLSAASRRPRVSEAAQVVCASALGANALTHLVRGAAQRRCHGGLATSPVLLGAATSMLRTSRGSLSPASRRRLGLAAALASPAAIVASLVLGRAIVREQ